VVPEPTSAVKVRLFGREYSIRGHGNKQYVEMLVDFITERSEAIQRQATVVSTLDLVILTLLNITDEMFQTKEAMGKTIRSWKRRPRNFSKRLIGSFEGFPCAVRLERDFLSQHSQQGRSKRVW